MPKISAFEICVKNMNLKIFATVTLFICLGFTSQAFAANQRDLEQLKATNSCVRCDLRGANLSKLNLSGANLREVNLTGANLSGANLSDADLTNGNLASAVLNGADLNNASLTGANLRAASLQNTDLSFTGMIGTNLESANLKGAKLLLTNFRGANFQLTTLPTGLVTSNKSYSWSLQRPSPTDCDVFKTGSLAGTTCYGQ
jgi:uncharacterized protein YjbI with pentapeptide repeats